MAIKKKAAKKVVKKVATKTNKKVAAKPAKKVVKKAAKPAPKAKKAPKPQKKAVKAKPAPAKAKAAAKPATKPAATPAPKATPKSTPQTVAAKAGTKPARRRGRARKIVEDKPVKRQKNIGPESVANVSFKKSDSFASRAAAVAKQNIKPNTDTRTRYSDKELDEFQALIEEKLAAARNELKYLQDQINRKDDNGTDDTENKFANMEDGSMSQEREYLTQMAARQVQYIENLEKAMVRIKNKTYGICRVTGKLIDKERLRIVPHATLSMEAKMMQK